MKFDLTKPCKSCPFRKDGAGVPLMPARIREIAASTGWNGAPFSCHATVDYDQEDEAGEFVHVPTPGEQHCAGALLFGLKNGGPHQLARTVARLGGIDAPALEANVDLVYDDVHEWLKHGAVRRRRSKEKKTR